MSGRAAETSLLGNAVVIEANAAVPPLNAQLLKQFQRWWKLCWTNSAEWKVFFLSLCCFRRSGLVLLPASSSAHSVCFPSRSLAGFCWTHCFGKRGNVWPKRQDERDWWAGKRQFHWKLYTIGARLTCTTRATVYKKKYEENFSKFARICSKNQQNRPKNPISIHCNAPTRLADRALQNRTNCKMLARKQQFH